MEKGKKVTILGAGNVGATIAYTLVLEGLADEIVLVDIRADKAAGEALDIFHAVPFSHNVNIYGGDYIDAAGSDVVIVTAGMNRKPGQTRIELAGMNVGIMKEIIPQIVSSAPDAVYIIVSNPVDIITYTFCKLSGLRQERIFGSGTMLDTARLRAVLGRRTKLPPTGIDANILGEHGDTMMIPWSQIKGMNFDDNTKNEIMEEVKTSGAKIIAAKGATYYGVAASVGELCRTVLGGTSSVHTVSRMLNGEYGISDVCISLPFTVDGNGVHKMQPLNLTDDETDKIKKSAEALQNIIKSLEI